MRSQIFFSQISGQNSNNFKIVIEEFLHKEEQIGRPKADSVFFTHLRLDVAPILKLGGEVVNQKSRWLRLKPAPDQLAGLEEEGGMDGGNCGLGSSHQGLHPEERPGCQGEVVEPTPLL